MSRILIIGANGQVGQELQHTLAPLGDVIKSDRRTLDLSHLESIHYSSTLR